MAAIWGPPGAGKSALAVVFARSEESASAFPDGIIAVDVRLCTTPDAIGRHFASLIGEPVKPEEDGWSASEIMQHRFGSRRCLLILDNADQGEFRSICPYGDSALMLTSKNKRLLCNMGLQEDELVHADRLTVDEAHQVLEKVLGAGKVAAEPAAVNALLRLLGYLAMAVRIAAGMIAEQFGSHPIADYLSRLQDQQSSLVEALKLEGDEELRLARVFELSMALLQERTPSTDSEDLCDSYARLSVSASSGFSRDAASAVLHYFNINIRPEDRLRQFVNLAWLEYTKDTDRFRFHPLLQAFARQKAKATNVFKVTAKMYRWFFEQYVREHAADTRDNLAALVMEQDSILMAAGERAMEGQFDPYFLKGINLLLERTGQWQVALDLAEASLNEGTQSEWIKAVLLLQRGKYRQNQGILDAAAADFEQSLIINKALGNPRGIAMVLNSLGGVKRDQDDLDGATADFAESLMIVKDLGDPHGIAMVLNSLGGVKRDRGDLNGAATDLVAVQN